MYNGCYESTVVRVVVELMMREACSASVHRSESHNLGRPQTHIEFDLVARTLRRKNKRICHTIRPCQESNLG